QWLLSLTAGVVAPSDLSARRQGPVRFFSMSSAFRSSGGQRDELAATVFVTFECPRCLRSARLGGDRAMIGLGDEKGAVGLSRGHRLVPPLDLIRRQRGEYLLLIAFDAFRAGHDRDQLRKASEVGQSKSGKAAVETHIGNALRRRAAANNTRRIDLGLQRRAER